MGGCASVEKADRNSVKRVLQQSFSSKNVKLVNPSPVKDESPISLESPISGRDFKSQWTPTQPVTAIRDLGSKEDTFFESQAWLESDCEDDFLSVKGDFTPSRGNTPVHHSFSKGEATTPRLNNISSPFDNNNNMMIKLAINDSSSLKPSPSPSSSDKKKKMLMELFRESIGGDQDLHDVLQMAKANEENGTTTTTTTTPHMTVKSSPLSMKEMTPIIKPVMKLGKCCFPRMSPGRTKKTSPIPTMD